MARKAVNDLRNGVVVVRYGPLRKEVSTHVREDYVILEKQGDKRWCRERRPSLFMLSLGCPQVKLLWKNLLKNRRKLKLVQ